MKKIILFAALWLFGYVTHATHLMGGQMTSQNIGGLTYQVTLTAYRDTQGVPMYTQAVINYNDAFGFSASHVAYASAPTVFGNGVEMYTYMDTITFPASGDYTMWWEDCCRNCALLNMTNPCGEYFHLYNVLHADTNNSSPVFLNPPITLAQENVAFNYNPLPFDADGDSIAWELDIPVSVGGAYVLGYSLPPSDTAIPFTMNQVTGEITFLPNTLGHFEVSVKVSEFRNGLKIGEIRRDMQIIVIPSKNKPANFGSSSNTFPYAGKQFNLTPGSAFSLTVTSTELDNNPVTMDVNGEPFLLNNNPAMATISNGSGQASATINWTPDASQLRAKPYIFSIRNTELFGAYSFSLDITFNLHVGSGTTGIKEDSHTDAFVNVYPNPNTGTCYLEVNALNAGKVNIRVTNVAGQLVKQLSDVQVQSGKNLVRLSTSQFIAGQYFIVMEYNGTLLGTQKMEVK